MGTHKNRRKEAVLLNTKYRFNLMSKKSFTFLRSKMCLSTVCCIQYACMIHLSEQDKLIELETQQAIVKRHGLHTYLEERMDSFQPEFYANISFSSQVLCCKHYISMYLGETWRIFDFL